MRKDSKASAQRGAGAPGQRADEVIRPKRSLRWKMLKWMWFLSVLPMVVSMLLFHHVIRKELASAYSSDAAMFCNVVAASLSDKLAGQWQRPVGDIIDRLKDDPRVAFVVVADLEGKPLHVGAFQSDAWSAFMADQRKVHGTEQKLGFGEEGGVKAIGHLIVQSAPIRRTVQDGGGDTVTVGHVLLGIQNRDLTGSIQTFELLQAATLGGTLVLCLPLAFWVTRQWVGPLRALMKSIYEFGRGGQATAVAIHSNDEVGVVAMAFNDMAGRLLASRSELRQANETLEKRVAERTTQLSEAVHRLEVMASTDPMTGLANRRAFRDQLGNLFTSSELDGDELNCVMIDLDGFKGVNDTLGHDKGDELIHFTAEVLRHVTRGVDVVARLGGDEFVILLPKVSEADAMKVAQRMLERFESESQTLFTSADPQPRVSMSIGLASYRRHRPGGADELIKMADAALYDAKGSGKACIRTYRGGGGNVVSGAA